MSTVIYYYSGTGNSLAIAKAIAEKIKAKLISIALVLDTRTVNIEADSIGIVFPCYLAQKYGIPLIIKRFVEKMQGIEKKYIFAVCTCGGWELVNALPALKKLSKLIKLQGGSLTGEFSMKLPMNNLTYPSSTINQNQEFMFERARQKNIEISEIVLRKGKNPLKSAKTLLNALLIPTYMLLGNLYVVHMRKMSKEPKHTSLSYFDMIHNSDKSISVDESCNGCSTCAKICPVGNIKMIDDKPVWQHHCEMCLACDEWCPQRAIRHWCKTEGKNYRHPSVTIQDMLKQTGY